MTLGRMTLALLTAGALAAVGVAAAQAGWTTVTKDELQICKPIFEEVHRLELGYIRKEAADYCTPGAQYYDTANCKTMQDEYADSQAQDALDWYYAGNDHCEGSDYPCFGPGLYNDVRTGEDATYWSQQFIADAAKPARITPDMDFNAAAFEGDRCIAQVWVKKFKALHAAPAPAAAPPAQAVAAKPPALKPDVAACVDMKKPGADQLARCDGVLTVMKPADPDYGSLAIALMQSYADQGRPADALRYGDMLAATKSGLDAFVTACAVRVIVKWDLDTGLKACTAAGAGNASALEARGQINLLAGRWQDAWNDFDAAYRLNTAGESLYLRGLAASALGKMTEALRDMADGEAKAPGSAQAYERDGYSLATVSKGQPLAPPEAFAAAASAPAAAPSPKAAPSGASSGANNAAAAPTPTPTPAPSAPASQQLPRFEPDAPRVVDALSEQQAQACEADASALQAESKTWQGTPDEIALKLALFQRTLYAGRCAGHPQAAGLAASAEATIRDAGPRAATAITTADQTTPVVTECVTPITPGDPRNTTRMSIFANSCAYPVTVTYCNASSAAGSWAGLFACETAGTHAMVSVPANGFAATVFGQHLNHFACRKPALPVTTYTEDGGLSGYCK